MLKLTEKSQHLVLKHVGIHLVWTGVVQAGPDKQAEHVDLSARSVNGKVACLFQLGCLGHLFLEQLVGDLVDLVEVLDKGNGQLEKCWAIAAQKLVENGENLSTSSVLCRSSGEERPKGQV